MFRRVVPCSACCLQGWICVAGAALGHVCLLSVSPAAVCVPPCRAVFRLLSPELDLRGRGSTWARLSVVCVAGGRLCPAVSWRVPLAVSRAGFNTYYITSCPTKYTAKVTILFHCFGGVNRSAAALCAFLIADKKYSAEEAVRALMSARAGQSYWHQREYFFDALVTVAKNRV